MQFDKTPRTRSVSKFIKWAGLTPPPADCFWPARRMFDTPAMRFLFKKKKLKIYLSVTLTAA